MVVRQAVVYWGRELAVQSRGGGAASKAVARSCRQRRGARGSAHLQCRGTAHSWRPRNGLVAAHTIALGGSKAS